MKELYTEEFRKIMQVNNDYSSMHANRVEEIRNFAKGAGFKRIGIAHCITFKREAILLEKYLSRYFDVYRIDCKYGRVTPKDIIGGSSNYVLCNPAGQADFLNKNNTELNISMGLCIGHDMIFNKKSEAYVTNLFDKDFTNKNNPAQALADIEKEIMENNILN